MTTTPHTTPLPDVRGPLTLLLGHDTAREMFYACDRWAHVDDEQLRATLVASGYRLKDRGVVSRTRGSLMMLGGKIERALTKRRRDGLVRVEVSAVQAERFYALTRWRLTAPTSELKSAGVRDRLDALCAAIRFAASQPPAQAVTVSVPDDEPDPDDTIDGALAASRTMAGGVLPDLFTYPSAP